MTNESNIRRDKHYICKLHVHWVFVSNSCRRVFDAREIDVPRSILADVCSDAQATRVEVDGEEDPVHLLKQATHHRMAVPGNAPWTTAPLSITGTPFTNT
jgi:REP element-mobilizing transposase RayT